MTVLMVILGLAYVVLCTWLVLIVLIQPSKGGGMGSLGGGSASAAISETLGASQAEKSLSKWTAWSTAAFFVIAILLTMLGTWHERERNDLDLGSGEAAAVTPAEPVATEEPGATPPASEETPPVEGPAPASE
ncbi:preprotein translocase subunit SecG [bacterium]|nr:preprotein translocase subunit SecG [bacterium]